jgi:hypothetical protein
MEMMFSVLAALIIFSRLDEITRAVAALAFALFVGLLIYGGICMAISIAHEGAVCVLGFVGWIAFWGWLMIRRARKEVEKERAEAKLRGLPGFQ